jgi:cytochrome c nitrite reductase small subunit
LDADEAQRRLAAVDPNEITEGQRRTPERMFCDQFTDFMILVLLAAAVISGLIGEAQDTVNSAACANCHIMQEQYDGWIKASHRMVAICNDCHTPPGFLAKYAAKASNGFWHSFAFTTGRFPERLRIGARNQAITEQAYRSCHRAIVEAIERPHREGAQLSCMRCNSEVGHF